MLEVHLVFDELDDGQQEFGVAQPAEDVFEDGEVFVLNAACDAVGEGGEYYDGDVGVGCLDVACDVEDVVVFGSGHTDDEVYADAFHLALAFFLVADLDKAGRKAQSELGVFGEDLFVYSTIVFEHEGVVGIGYEQDVEDASLHEVYNGVSLSCMA